MEDPSITWLEDRVKLLRDRLRHAQRLGMHTEAQIFEKRLIECELRLQAILHRYNLADHPEYRRFAIH